MTDNERPNNLVDYLENRIENLGKKYEKEDKDSEEYSDLNGRIGELRRLLKRVKSNTDRLVRGSEFIAYRKGGGIVKEGVWMVRITPKDDLLEIYHEGSKDPIEEDLEEFLNNHDQSIEITNYDFLYQITQGDDEDEEEDEEEKEDRDETVHDLISDVKEMTPLQERDISRLYPKREDSGSYDQLKKSGWRKLRDRMEELTDE